MPANYTYHIPNPSDPHMPTKADEIFDALSPEKRKEVCDQAWQDEQRNIARANLPKEIDRFLALCEDFDNTQTPDNATGCSSAQRSSYAALIQPQPLLKISGMHGTKSKRQALT